MKSMQSNDQGQGISNTNSYKDGYKQAHTNMNFLRLVPNTSCCFQSYNPLPLSKFVIVASPIVSTNTSRLSCCMSPLLVSHMVFDQISMSPPAFLQGPIHQLLIQL